MHKRFWKLDQVGKGYVSKQDFLSIPEVISRLIYCLLNLTRMVYQLAGNPLASRIMSAMDSDDNDHIDFEEFVRAVAVFGPGSDPEEKMNSNYSQPNLVKFCSTNR